MNRYRIDELNRVFAQRLLSKRPHLVQNSLTWFEFIRAFSRERDRSVTISREGVPVAFVLALQHENLIQSLPYPASYSGIRFDPTVSDAETAEICEFIFEFYRNKADIFSVCTSPDFISDQRLLGCFDYILENPVQYLDLSPGPLNGTTSKFRNNLKRNCDKAERAGVAVDTGVDDRTLGLWYDCYSRRMNELGATPLPREYFQAMRDHLAPIGQIELLSARQGKQYLGGILTIFNEYCADYFLSVFDRENDHTQCSTYAFSLLIQWARGRGIRYLNLQSSPGTDSQVYQFKRSWGALESSHRYQVKLLRNHEQVRSLSPAQAADQYRFHFYLPYAALAGHRAQEIMATNSELS